MAKLKLELLVLQPSALEALRGLHTALEKYTKATKATIGLTATSKGRREIFDKRDKAHLELLGAAAYLTGLTVKMENVDARFFAED